MKPIRMKNYIDLFMTDHQLKPHVEFTINEYDLPTPYYFDEDYYLFCRHERSIAYAILVNLLQGKLTITKAQRTPEFTELDKWLLSMIPEGYDWIARDADEDARVFVYEVEPQADDPYFKGIYKLSLEALSETMFKDLEPGQKYKFR